MQVWTEGLRGAVGPRRLRTGSTPQSAELLAGVETLTVLGHHRTPRGISVFRPLTAEQFPWGGGHLLAG